MFRKEKQPCFGKGWLSPCSAQVNSGSNARDKGRIASGGWHLLCSQIGIATTIRRTAVRGTGVSLALWDLIEGSPENTPIFYGSMVLMGLKVPLNWASIMPKPM